ncbi:uncharacterized protein LOC100569295 isoform X14 [Acyrthosiphon pisum]|uniref:WD repeat-containing protein 55 homolog n=1 Tax=Acyrthosiphon pisum TaxID=7029 RepID=A0A8R2H6T0_ACYPI|nr:uncharacterized protein LOC100569295 isoform X14 [Acyrthosiphon pisum]|eukprot:XP_016656516.1 PREDICTED: uncharacterized protein LOC100569295 isoform X1 [Acyrthosiphon pisum]
MHFALATTQGGRPTTVTTAAMSNDSPRTSAVPAPTSYLPHAVPSTSQGVGATSADASTGPNSDDLTAGGSQITMEDYNDTSSEDEYQKSGSTFTMALGHYFFERNLIETPNNYQASKPVIDYVNLKFVENNFRTLGLDEMFDKNNIRRAETEFESFEVWFSHLKKYAADREYIRDLRLPLFCHLYLNLYAPHNHARLQAFLKTFKYLFASPKGNIYLEELRNVTDILNLSPRLEYFRRNKFVYGVSPMFVNRLYDFFQINFMLQVVFQEWIDINYITYEDPRIVFDEKCTNNQEQVNNLDEANAPKTLNLSQNKNINRKVNNSKNDYYNNQRSSMSKDFVGSSSGSSFQVSNSRKLANNCVEDQQKQDTNSELDKNFSIICEQSTEYSEQLTEYFKQFSTEDRCLEPRSRRSKKSTDNSEQSSTEDRCLEPRSRRSKKSTDNSEQSSTEDRCLEPRSRRSKKSTEYSEQSSTEDRCLEPRSRRSKKISNEGRKSRKHRKKHKLRRKKKSTSDNNSHKSSNETSNNDEQLQKKIKSSDRRKTTGDQNSRSCEKSFEISDDDYKEKKCKRQNKSNGSKSTNDDNNMQMSESLSEVSDSEQKKYKSQKNSGRCKSTNYDNNTQMKENLSEVSDGEKKKYRRQKIRGKNKSISDDNMHISNDDEKKQKRQNKRSKTKSTSDDNNRMSEISSDEQKFQKPQNKKKLRGKKKSDHNIDDSSLCGSSPEDITTILMIIIFLMMSKNQESSNKDKEIHKSNARRKYELINSNTSLSESCSAGDSLEDSSSLYSSSCDEELLMRKYMRKIKKSTQYLRYETSHYLKPIKVTKINLKTLDEDLYLHLSRKIILKNCGKVSCSFLTSDQNLVVAGSVDALIYLWERDNEQSVSEESHDVLHTIGNINSSTFSSSVQENNLVEYLDKSKAFILRGHGGPIFDLAELPSAKILLSASDDKTYRAWDLRTKQCIEIYNGHEHRTWCIAASPYSLQVATGSCEGASCLWFLNYKRPLRMFIGHLDDILVLKFHPNQVFLATGSSDKTVRVFELTTGDCHRVLMGHTDYITCLEFNTENFNYLASAAGNGEIIVWDVPSGEIVWRIGVGKVLFSDLVWITKDVLLASLTTGVVLKCDTTLNYIDSSCKVNGFETPFYRLISLQMINNTVYTIGIPDKSGGLKPISKRTKEKALQTKSERQKSQKEPSPLSKLFFPQHIIDNNGNSMTPLRGLSSLIPNPTYDFEYQINTNDQLNKSTLPNFLSMNLKSAPFNLSADEISKLSSEYQSKNIRLIPASDITNNLRNAYLLPVQKNIRTSNANSVNAHSTNVQLPSTSKSQKLNKTHAPPKSKITKAKQHNFGNSSLTMHTSIQHMQIKTTTAQEQLHLDDHKDTNMLVQQYLQTMGTSTHKQQTSNLLQVKRPGMSSPLLQNSIVQQDQKMQLQHGTGSNSSVAGTNVQQQQLLQQSRSNTNLTKGNVQQRLSPQTNNRSSNVTKRSSSRQSPNKSSSLDDTGTGKHTRMQ